MFFLLSGMNATEMTVLSVFWHKNGLGTLGVNREFEKFFTPLWKDCTQELSNMQRRMNHILLQPPRTTTPDMIKSMSLSPQKT